MSLESPAQLTRGRIPELDGVIIGTGSQKFPI